MERFGVRKIAALGAPFNPALHEAIAITEVDEPSHGPGTVVQVVQDGYTIHDRLLRPARVIVNRRRSEQESQGGQPSDPQEDAEPEGS
jgi:molecular chaperone GrpE